MLYAGLDLSRKRLDVHLLDAEGATVEAGAAPPDADGLRGLSQRLERHRAPIRAAIESMNGARFVHDRLELAGWQVEIADAQKVKGLAPLACKTDRIDAWVLAELAGRDLVPAIWLPDPLVRAERERARWAAAPGPSPLQLEAARARGAAHPRQASPVSDLFGVRGRRLLANLALPEPWQGTIEASLRLIDELDREIGDREHELCRRGADHRYVPLLCTVPGTSWVLAYTIAAELGDINRFPSPRKLAGYLVDVVVVESERRGRVRQEARCRVGLAAKQVGEEVVVRCKERGELEALDVERAVGEGADARREQRAEALSPSERSGHRIATVTRNGGTRWTMRPR